MFIGHVCVSVKGIRRDVGQEKGFLVSETSLRKGGKWET